MNRKQQKALPLLSPLIARLPKGNVWFRGHAVQHGAIHFSREKQQRWDSPTGAYGVLYAGEDVECVFMESIGRTALETRFLSRTLLENCGLSKVRLLRELRLLDLAASGGLARVGAEGSISSGSKYFSSQKWSQGFHDHPEKLDGVLYFARHDPTRKAYALFDRCEDAIAVLGPCLSWASQPELLGRILDLYKLGTDL